MPIVFLKDVVLERTKIEEKELEIAEKALNRTTKGKTVTRLGPLSDLKG